MGFKKFIVAQDEAKTNQKSLTVMHKNKLYECLNFDDIESFNKFVDKHEFFKKHNIQVPKLIAKSKKLLIVVRELIQGDTCDVLVKNNAISDVIFEKLFQMYKMCRVYKFDLDYMPENYIFIDNKLYYMSLETFKKNEQYALETYGLYYWIYSKEGVSHLKELGHDVSKIAVINKGESNKNVVLLTIKYW